ncbi:translocon-associated protein subunit alpha [Klebsormidium nitens]|uniref:Translocon-associated protein subunit alpha n=1 Tax=Klebsormidium nitens TaxID=105231 RepID=A0A1Y1IMY7_KLENI|nr:translocon-associated protein subunit alpha [Klebsormidium nitens]|eukprot:GAQ91472.1 translocon-associated protein subunit alpha [Klebsormidium nitens]
MASRKQWTFWALLFASLLLSSCVLRAAAAVDDDDVYEDDEEEVDLPPMEEEVTAPPERVQPQTITMYPEGLPGVETVFVFPNNVQRQVPAGAPVDLLVGLANNGDSSITVKMIAGYLSYSRDYSQVIQNFTQFPFDTTVEPGEQHSFAYTFATHKLLQPHEFGFTAAVYYESDGAVHSNVFYNGTVEVVEPSGILSGENAFLALLALALLSLLGYWAYSQVQKLTKKKGGRRKVVETGTRSDASDNEWLKGTSADPRRRSSGTIKVTKKKE